MKILYFDVQDQTFPALGVASDSPLDRAKAEMLALTLELDELDQVQQLLLQRRVHAEERRAILTRIIG